MDFNSLLQLMVHKNASDLFITTGMPPSLKIYGRLKPVTKTALSMAQAHEIVTDLMTSPQKEEFERTNECNFAISAAGLGQFVISPPWGYVEESIVEFAQMVIPAMGDSE